MVNWDGSTALVSINVEKVSGTLMRTNDTHHTNGEDAPLFQTLRVGLDGGVLNVTIDAPPMNLLGPELVRDLVWLIQWAEPDERIQVLVFTSADPDYFIAHVDVTRIAEYRAEAARLTGEASIAAMFHYLSASRLITIAQIEGRVRGAGDEFVLSCDMRFGARETAVFAQFEAAFGQLPGGGATQYLTRLLGRGRALEVLLSADDFSADLAEQYGWINRSLPGDEIGDFVQRLAHRIASFPAAGHTAIKQRVNHISLAPLEDFRFDSDRFGQSASTPETQRLFAEALRSGFQQRETERDLARWLETLTTRSQNP
jgi:enoyl-CoA hydratase/carnithine racemase